MKLRKESAAGSKMAVRGGVLVHDKDGVCEVESEELYERLIKQGWKPVGGKKKKDPPAEPKSEPAPKAEPKAKKKEVPKEEPKEEEPKEEEPKEAPKKEEVKEKPKKKVKKSFKRERPSFKRGSK